MFVGGGYGGEEDTDVIQLVVPGIGDRVLQQIVTISYSDQL